MASYVTLLQVQADREQHLPQKRTKPAALLRRAPTQARQAGQIRTRRQVTPTFPPVPSQTLRTPTSPPTPTQARVTPTFLIALNLAQGTLTSETMAGVEALAPNPSIPGFPGIFSSSRPGPTRPPKRSSRVLRPCHWGRGHHLWFA